MSYVIVFTKFIFSFFNSRYIVLHIFFLSTFLINILLLIIHSVYNNNTNCYINKLTCLTNFNL